MLVGSSEPGRYFGPALMACVVAYLEVHVREGLRDSDAEHGYGESRRGPTGSLAEGMNFVHTAENQIVLRFTEQQVGRVVEKQFASFATG